MNNWQTHLKDEAATVAMGGKLAEAIKAAVPDKPVTLYLEGDLGAGKTTLSRGIVCGFGHQGAVKSPTYTLVEPYELPARTLYHFDLYRLADPEELEFMGVRDYFDSNAICLVEWPSRGQGFLPDADLLVDMVYVNDERNITLTAQNAQGEAVLAQLSLG